MTKAPTVLFRDDVLTLGAWNDLVIEAWSREASVAHFRTLRAHMLAHARGHDARRIAILSVVRLPSLSSLDEGIRREVNERQREMRPYTKAAAVVMESTGFAASLVRGMLAGLMLVERGSPSKIAESFDVAATWLAPHLTPPDGERVSAAGLRDVYQQLVSVSTPVGTLRR